MTDHRRTDTGPVTLPEFPTKVAQHKVHELADLGMMRKPPTTREYEHAALEVAIKGETEQEVYAVLSRLTDADLLVLADSLTWVRSGVDMLLSERGYTG